MHPPIPDNIIYSLWWKLLPSAHGKYKKSGLFRSPVGMAAWLVLVQPCYQTRDLLSGPTRNQSYFRLNLCKIGHLFGLWASIIVMEHTRLFLASLHHLDGCRCPGAKMVPCHEQPTCHRVTGSYYVTSVSDYSHETQYVGKRSGRLQPPVGFFTLFVGSSPHRDDALWLHQMAILS